jgi:RNA-directed DNA polymerase
MRQKLQQTLTWDQGEPGEARSNSGSRTEASAATDQAKHPTSNPQMMEEVCQRENLLEALQRVRANQGSPGVDGMTLDELPDYLREHWPVLREQLLSGTYQPQPVKRVNIPKPDGKGVRQLGIPTVLDRFVQQALLQVLQRDWDPTFSLHSYGFRPGRSAHQAVAQAQQHIADGYRWVVDLDLEKFFDRVSHDRLMSRVAQRVSDKRVLKLIRAFLSAGAVEGVVVTRSTEGTPQGGPLSPLLSNLVLDELDRELERRGHRFVRYADDCNIYVRSRRAGERVMNGVTRFISHTLKLTVNQAKSAVARPWERKFLGFSFTPHHQPKRRIAPQALERFKKRVRILTRRTRGISLEQMLGELGRYLRGWLAYFRFCETPSVLRELDSWIKRRLRCFVWKQWRTGRRRFHSLLALRVSRDHALRAVHSKRGLWRMSGVSALTYALPNAHFMRLGLPPLHLMASV